MEHFAEAPKKWRAGWPLGIDPGGRYWRLWSPQAGDTTAASWESRSMAEAVGEKGGGPGVFLARCWWGPDKKGCTAWFGHNGQSAKELHRETISWQKVVMPGISCNCLETPVYDHLTKKLAPASKPRLKAPPSAAPSAGHPPGSADRQLRAGQLLPDRVGVAPNHARSANG